MKKMKRALALGLAMSLALSSLAGCGSKATESTSEAAGTSTGEAASTGDEQVTLTFWSWLPTTIQWEEMVVAFEEQYPNIKIDYTRTEQDDFMEKLQVAMASGTGPDLFGLSTGTMATQYAPFVMDMSELADQYMPG